MAASQPPAGDQAPRHACSACLRRPRAGKAPGSVGGSSGSSSAQPFSFLIWARVILFQSCGILFVCFISFFFVVVIFMSCVVFPKHVPSALHRRYTFLEEMLQSHRVSGVFSLIGIGWYVKGVIQQFSFINRERKRFVFNVARSASCPKMKKIRAD